MRPPKSVCFQRLDTEFQINPSNGWPPLWKIPSIRITRSRQSFFRSPPEWRGRSGQDF
jgi:hypothetical protein